MKNAIRLVIYGLISWIVPFVVAVPFYTKEGTLLIDIHFFKTIMLIVSALTGGFLLVSMFKRAEGRYLREGIVIGAVWLVINLLLDFLILLPMSKMDVATYFMQIGLRYLLIPIMSISTGWAVGIAKKN